MRVGRTTALQEQVGYDMDVGLGFDPGAGRFDSDYPCQNNLTVCGQTLALRTLAAKVRILPVGPRTMDR